MYLNYGNIFVLQMLVSQLEAIQINHFEKQCHTIKTRDSSWSARQKFWLPYDSLYFTGNDIFFIIPAHRKKRENYSAKGLNLRKKFLIISPLASNVF